MDRPRTTVPRIIVVDQDQAAGQNEVPKLPHTFHTGVIPIRIEAEKCDRRRSKGGKRLLEKPLENVDAKFGTSGSTYCPAKVINARCAIVVIPRRGRVGLPSKRSRTIDSLRGRQSLKGIEEVIVAMRPSDLDQSCTHAALPASAFDNRAVAHLWISQLAGCNLDIRDEIVSWNHGGRLILAEKLHCIMAQTQFTQPRAELQAPAD